MLILKHKRKSVRPSLEGVTNNSILNRFLVILKGFCYINRNFTTRIWNSAQQHNCSWKTTTLSMCCGSFHQELLPNESLLQPKVNTNSLGRYPDFSRSHHGLQKRLQKCKKCPPWNEKNKKTRFILKKLTNHLNETLKCHFSNYLKWKTTILQLFYSSNGNLNHKVYWVT